MKINGLYAAVIAAGCLLAASCNEPDNENRPGTGDAPAIAFTIQGNLMLEFDALSGSVDYVVTNPVEGATLSVAAEEGCDWITDFDTSVEGTVSFVTTENLTTETRSTILTLTYTYSAEDEVSCQINVIQGGSPYVYDFEAVYAQGYYYSNRTSTHLRYFLWLTENPIDRNGNMGAGYSYLFDIYSDKEPENMEAIAPPAGRYTLSDNNVPGTFGRYESRMYESSSNRRLYFEEGHLTITQNGDEYTVEAVVTDTANVQHRIRYTGKIALLDYTEEPPVSSLEEDVVTDLSLANMSALYYGQCYNDETSNWFLTLSPMPTGSTGDTFTLDICSPATSNMETGITPGKYEIQDAFYTQYSTLMGFILSGNRFGSWYYMMERGQQGDAVAPLVEGTVEVSRDGDTYTFRIEAWDDANPPHKVSGTWSGPVTMQDMSN